MAENMAPRILVVDDDVELGVLLSDYLGTEGFQTECLLNGEEAVAAVAMRHYDAVILDIMLPRMSGTEVLRRIRAESQIPVIMLTAKGDDIDRVIGLELGADDYVPKPYFPRELVARLRAVLRRQVAAPAAAPGLPFATHPESASYATLCTAASMVRRTVAPGTGSMFPTSLMIRPLAFTSTSRPPS